MEELAEEKIKRIKYEALLRIIRSQLYDVNRKETILTMAIDEALSDY